MGVIVGIAAAVVSVAVAAFVQATIGFKVAATVAGIVGPFAFWVVIIATGFASGGLGAYVFSCLRPHASRFAALVVFVASTLGGFFGVLVTVNRLFMSGGPYEL